MMMKNSKKGFNLIEIAIVLAVVGLVIGGIYVAASSVTDNQRRQKAQTQLIQIVQNIRTAYSSQVIPTASAVIDFQTANALRLVPADMTRIGTGNTFNGAYGPVTLNIGGADSNTMEIKLEKLSRGACSDILAKNFGSQSAVNQIGLTLVTNLTTATTQDGITVAEATGTVCTADSNDITFTFTVH